MGLICWVIMILGIYVQQSVSEMVQCFSEFSLSTGVCSDLLGVTTVDKCCINPSYGYKEADGVSKSCRRAMWSEWSPWSKCTVTCNEGVRQRKRMCYGKGSCVDSEQLGTVQTEPCEDQNCCPVQGGWTEWGSWQPCSVTCETGIKKRQRTCTNPPPQCGGFCVGQLEDIAACDTETVCPTHGGWTSWESWGPCQGTCVNEGHKAPNHIRKRTCTNPPPSKVPRGRDCDGSDTDSRFCTGLPYCHVDGNWGSWSAPSPCSVTCGVGRNIQYRTCDSPNPKHGGKYCQGDDKKNSLCAVPDNCPLNGVWSEWAPWDICKPTSNRKINCQKRQGRRRRDRYCVGIDYNGDHCKGEIVEHGNCYDINNCDMKAVMSEWSNWSYCKPDCGPNSNRTREKVCIVDTISAYGVQDMSFFSGKPNINCKGLEKQTEIHACKNMPECKDKI